MAAKTLSLENYATKPFPILLKFQKCDKRDFYLGLMLYYGIRIRPNPQRAKMFFDGIKTKPYTQFIDAIRVLERIEDPDVRNNKPLFEGLLELGYKETRHKSNEGDPIAKFLFGQLKLSENGKMDSLGYNLLKNSADAGFSPAMFKFSQLCSESDRIRTREEYNYLVAASKAFCFPAVEQAFKCRLGLKQTLDNVTVQLAFKLYALGDTVKADAKRFLEHQGYDVVCRTVGKEIIRASEKLHFVPNENMDNIQRAIVNSALITGIGSVPVMVSSEVMEVRSSLCVLEFYVEIYARQAEANFQQYFSCFNKHP